MSDGTRTRDVLDHNQVLYQLSYTHRDPSRRRLESLAVPRVARFLGGRHGSVHRRPLVAVEWKCLG